jgi:citrate lyase subunit beta / citryl-CoA lyase
MFIALYIPADRLPNLERLSASPPDALIIDLEESVAPENLKSAREGLACLVDRLRPIGSSMAIRINGLDTSSGFKDLRALDKLPQDIALVLPKPVNTAALKRAAETGRELWIMGEERDIAENISHYAHNFPSLTTVIIGIKDLCHSLGIVLEPSSNLLRAAARTIKQAAHTAQLRVIDGVAFGDDTQMEQAVLRSYHDKFEGLTAMMAKDIVRIRTFAATCQSDLILGNDTGAIQ